MTKQQAIDQLRAMQAWHEDFGNGPCPDYDAICYAIGAIEEAPEGLDNLIKALEQEHKKLLEMQKAQHEQRWIPCSERLPDEDGTYIVSGIWGSGKEQVGECEYHVEDGYFWTAWNFDVKAWMPLPKPWEGEAK